MKSKPGQPSLFGNLPEPTLCADFNGSTTYKKRIKLTAAFAAERHNVYIRRNQGLPKPWTQDPILRNYRFCNIYRELDKVTVWIMDNWINPFVDSDDLAARALIGRLINHPDTLQKMLDAEVFGARYNQAKTWKLFQSIKESKEKLVTGAYIVNTLFPKDHAKVDGSKGDYIANFFIPQVWANRTMLQKYLRTGSFEETLTGMTCIHGVGRFIGNQAVVDLSYTKHLNKAKDLNTAWSPGPGTCKGIKMVTDNWDLTGGSEEMARALTTMRNDVNEELSKLPNFHTDTRKMKTHIVPLTAPNASNLMCEVGKYWGMVTGARDRLKNTYKG